MIPKNVNNSHLLSILYNKQLREYKKPKYEMGDRVRISRYDLPFKKVYKPQITELFS